MRHEVSIDFSGPFPDYNPQLGRCWIWNGRVSPNGYGRISILGKDAYAHRVSYILFIGDITKGLVLDHLCRVRRCVNPSHLESVSIGENVRRGSKALTHCRHGHPYSGENLYIRKDTGHRCCKACGAHSHKMKRDQKRQHKVPQ